MSKQTDCPWQMPDAVEYYGGVLPLHEDTPEPPQPDGDVPKTEPGSLEGQLETERLRLAACGVVALANTRESAAQARQMNGSYHSGSLESVMQAVDREMDYREALEKVKHHISTTLLEVLKVESVPMRSRLTQDLTHMLSTLNEALSK